MNTDSRGKTTPDKNDKSSIEAIDLRLLDGPDSGSIVRLAGMEADDWRDLEDDVWEGDKS